MNLDWKFPTKWKELPREDYRVRGKKNVYRVPLTLEEPLKTGRTHHPVTSGVPIPEGWLADPSNCRLLDEKRRELPLQTQALARWPDGSVKWLLLDFQINTRPRGKRRVTLEFGKSIRSKARHQAPVSVIEIADGVEIETGNHRFEISHHQFPFGLQAVFTARSTEGNRDGKYLASAEEIKIEERGPLRAVIRVSGWHYREDGRQSMPFVLRFTAWAGSSALGVQHTFIISDDPLTTFWRGIGLEIPVGRDAEFSETRDGLATVHGSAPEGYLFSARSAAVPAADSSTVSVPEQTASKRRDAAATRSRDGCATLNRYPTAFGAPPCLGGLVRWSNFLHPKENVFDPASGTLGVYLWPLHGAEMDLRPVLIRRPPDFEEWTQKYPDAFHHIEGGALSKAEAEDAFGMKKPCPSMGDMRGRNGKGMGKTHEIFIGEPELLPPFDAPLFAQATPQYYAFTRAFGQFHPYDPKNFPVIERAMETHLTWVWRHIHEWSKWTGIFDYGDYLSIYDGKRRAWWKYDGGRWGWLNGEVNAEQGLFVQFLRTGKRQWLDFAEAAAWHRIDCDQLHWHDQFPELIGGMHRHYMTEHWSGQIDCGHIWVDGAINLYYLFGFRRGLECATEGAEMAARFTIPIVLHHGDTSRETNNGLRCLARVYEATGDARYREMAEVIARGYLLSFDEHGVPTTVAEAERRLEKEFGGTKWWPMPEIIKYNWHGHCGYQYIGYFAPAVRYWETIGRTQTSRQLVAMFDQYSPALDLGNEGQFFGEKYIETKDPRYLTPIIRGLPGTIQFPVPTDELGTQPGSYSNPRLDYLCGIPYVLAAFYDARGRMKEFEAKPSAKVPGYRAPAKRTAGDGGVPLDLSRVVNTDPRANPFGRQLEDEFAHKLPDLKPGQIGFQPYNGAHALHAGYVPVSAHQVYPSTAQHVTPNHYAAAGLPYGGTVEYGGVTYRFVNPEANAGKAIIVLKANQSVTIPVGQEGRALHFLGHVHGKKQARQISQFASTVLGQYVIRYADGTTQTVELVNGVHFDSFSAMRMRRASRTWRTSIGCMCSPTSAMTTCT